MRERIDYSYWNRWNQCNWGILWKRRYRKEKGERDKLPAESSNELSIKSWRSSSRSLPMLLPNILLPKEWFAPRILFEWLATDRIFNHVFSTKKPKKKCEKGVIVKGGWRMNRWVWFIGDKILVLEKECTTRICNKSSHLLPLMPSPKNYSKTRRK